MERADWLIWRHNSISASDAACLYGANPYKTIETLYAEKLLPEPIDRASSFVMQKGNDLEPILRQKFCAWWAFDNGEDPFSPELCELEGHPYIRASLDGLSRNKKTLVEIKYVGKKVLEAGAVPKHYWIQVQHQMLCSGALNGFVIMGIDEANFKIIPVERDNSFINAHIILCQQFWQNVQMKKVPESNIDIVEDAPAVCLAEEYEALDQTRKDIEAQMALVKEELLKFCTKHETHINRLKIVKITTKGSIDYSTVDILKGIDLEPYRKQAKESFRITIDNPKGEIK